MLKWGGEKIKGIEILRNRYLNTLIFEDDP
jgi:hypothetical protein